jgi:hypothetical protein
MPTPNSRRKISYPISFVLLPLILAFGTPAYPDSLSQSVLASFPKNISELAYSDFAKARQFPWFAQFKRQTLPTGFGELEHFLSAAGIDPSKQIDEIAWSLSATNKSTNDDASTRAASQRVTTDPSSGSPDLAKLTPANASNTGDPNTQHDLPESDHLLAIALGQFDEQASEAILEQNKVATVSWRGYTLYSCGAFCHNFYVVFLDSSTVAFGQPLLLEHMLEVRSGAEESVLSNKVLFPLIHKINGDGIFWGVLNDAGTHGALLQLLPESGSFPDITKLLSRMRAMTIVVDGDDQLDAELDVSAAPEDAVPLTQIMQAGLLLRQFQASQEDPPFAKILQNVTIVPAGTGIQITFELTSDQMVSLIQHNTFSPKI